MRDGVVILSLELANEPGTIFINASAIALIQPLKIDESPIANPKRVRSRTEQGKSIVTLHNGSAFWVKGSPRDVARLIGPVRGM